MSLPQIKLYKVSVTNINNQKLHGLWAVPRDSPVSSLCMFLVFRLLLMLSLAIEGESSTVETLVSHGSLPVFINSLTGTQTSSFVDMLSMAASAL